MQKLPTIRAFIDRLSEKKATLLLGDDESITVTVPIEWLPKGVREGQVLRLVVQVDQHATEAGRHDIRSLLGKMGDEP